MLDKFRRGQRWLTGIFIAVIGGVFVFFLGLGGPLQPGAPTGDFVVQIDEIAIDRVDFDRLRETQEQRMREALGDQFDERNARAYLDQQTLRGVVEQAILANSADELGLKVTKREVQRYLRANPGFRDENGRFDQQQVIDVIERFYGSQRSFLRTIEREFKVQKFVGLLYEQISVSDNELESLVRSGLEEVSFAYVPLDASTLPADAEPTDEDVATYLAENDAALRAEFESRKAEFSTPERVRARHLLVTTPPDSDEQASEVARARADDARERIVAGADFAEVAKEVSMDLGTRDTGGDLGFVSRDELSLALADVAFSLEPGALSDVVESERGFHVVRVEEKQVGGERGYDEVGRELARAAVRSDLARERAHSLAGAISDAVRTGSSLEDAAREHQLTLVRTAPLRRRPDGYIQDLGAAPEVMATIFALEPGTSSPRIFEVESKLLLVSVTSKNAPDADIVAEQVATLRGQVIEQRRNEVLRSWIDAEQARLTESGRLKVDSSLVVGS